jgi:hypothetical protein
MVSGERKMERMQSHLEELWENMKRIESGLDEVKSTHRRDVITQFCACNIRLAPVHLFCTELAQ